MKIVPANETYRKDGFDSAIELEEAEIENIRSADEKDDVTSIIEVAQKIIDFARQHSDLIIDDGEGETILIQVDNCQLDLFVDVDDLKDMLPCIV